MGTTQSRENGGLGDLLKFDPVTDQWLITDQQLQNIDQVSFSTTSGAFWNLDVAEIIRIDTGNNANTVDKVEIVTTGGHKVKLWEDAPDLEIQWSGSTMWEKILIGPFNGSGGRRLHDNADGSEVVFTETEDGL